MVEGLERDLCDEPDSQVDQSLGGRDSRLAVSHGFSHVDDQSRMCGGGAWFIRCCGRVAEVAERRHDGPKRLWVAIRLFSGHYSSSEPVGRALEDSSSQRGSNYR